MTLADAKKEEVKGEVELCSGKKTSFLNDSSASLNCMKQVKQFAHTKR